MTRKEKRLPTPPHRPFARGRKTEAAEERSELTADKMAIAAAEGKLDEFLKKELPDNEYARNLASMMMGMTGMMPGGVQSPVSPTENSGTETPTDVPEDVRQAIAGGDVQGLMEMLRREHRKRNPEAEAAGSASEQTEAEQVQAQGTPAIDKEFIDALVRIARENSVSLDWIILRAIKLYVREYERTGRL